MKNLSLPEIRTLLEAALEEDVGGGDVTSEALVPESARARGSYIAKEALVVAGIPVARELVLMGGSTLEFRAVFADGDKVEAGAVLAEVEGNARAILKVERASLNFMQRLSGIASLTRRYVEAVEGTGAIIVDTRKTVPGHRVLDKYAVRCGGGTNHRFGLFDALLIKNNHLEFRADAGEAVEQARRERPDLPLEIEVRDFSELRSAIRARPDLIMLDNFTPADTARAVEVAGGGGALESSGGITLDNVRAYAETGVDRISVGSITHSVRASDIHLRVSLLS